MSRAPYGAAYGLLFVERYLAHQRTGPRVRRAGVLAIAALLCLSLGSRFRHMANSRRTSMAKEMSQTRAHQGSITGLIAEGLAVCMFAAVLYFIVWQ